jgi:hypothetical protein
MVHTVPIVVTGMGKYAARRSHGSNPINTASLAMAQIKVRLICNNQFIESHNLICGISAPRDTLPRGKFPI